MGAFSTCPDALHRLNERLEAEAKRIAHALHDEAGQLLVTVYFALETLARDLPPGHEAQVEEVRARLKEVENELRQLSHELRPPMLDEIGLIPALDFLAQGVSKRSGIHINITGRLSSRLPPLVEIALYRSAQEALNNISKHAHATNVDISLKQQHHDSGTMIVCSVKDDGAGFPPSAINDSTCKGLGVLGMKERVQASRWLVRNQINPRQRSRADPYDSVCGRPPGCMTFCNAQKRVQNARKSRRTDTLPRPFPKAERIRRPKGASGGVFVCSRVIFTGVPSFSS